MRNLKKFFEQKWFTNALSLCIAVLFWWLLMHIGSLSQVISRVLRIFNPIILGLVIAYLLDPIACFFETKVFGALGKEGARRVLGTACAFLCFILAFGVLLMILIPSVFSSIKGIIDNLPYYRESIDGYITYLQGVFANLDFSGFQSMIDDALTGIISFMPKSIETIVNTSIGIGAMMFNWVLGIILSIYFLVGKKRLLLALSRLRHAMLTDKAYDSHTTFFIRCHKILIRFIGFDLLDALIVGGTNAVFMVIAGMPFIPLISMIAGITNLIPNFGPVVGCGIGAVILLFGSPVQALVFVIFTIALQLVDGYIIKPKLFGDSLGVPPVWVLISVILGGATFGVIGIFLAIPVTAILHFIYHETFIPALKRNKEKAEKREEDLS